MNNIKIYESNRFYTRELSLDDHEYIYSYTKDSDFCKYLLWGPNTKSDVLKFINFAIELVAQKPRLRYEMAIVDKESDNMVGTCALRFTNDMKKCELAYAIATEHQNRGIATEIATMLKNIAFKNFSVNEVFATTDERNLASQRVLAKVGFIKKDKIESNRLIDGKYYNSLLFKIQDE